ncbi:MAG: hypothetical protein M1833_003406 [Piccolia ochrophora]|nr:MAG: hypothetical protein M1833_003406 [Piccolia ochrophora]
MLKGTDCSIFIIAVVTLISLTQQKVVIRDTSLIAKCLACGAAWILPIITSFTALSLDLYHPVSGNWCWIQAKPIYLRYVLTHMWRFLGILLSAIIYAYIYLWVHRHFREMKMLGPQSYGANSSYGAASSGVDAERGVKHGHVKLSPDDGTNSATSISTPYPSGYPLPSTTPPPRGISVAKSFTFKESFVHEQPADTLVDYNNEKAPQHLPHVTPFRSPPPPVPPVEHGPAVTEAYIKRTLLLNAYPIMYILLWVPGIANRIAEASGHPSRVLVIMQASTQYVGLANAITYGLNEKVLGQLKAMVAKNSGERSVERCL